MSPILETRRASGAFGSRTRSRYLPLELVLQHAAAVPRPTSPRQTSQQVKQAQPQQQQAGPPPHAALLAQLKRNGKNELHRSTQRTSNIGERARVAERGDRQFIHLQENACVCHFLSDSSCWRLAFAVAAEFCLSHRKRSETFHASHSAPFSSTALACTISVDQY